MLPIPPPPIAASPAIATRQTDVELRDAAKKLEATFLSEMLKSAGFDASLGEFGGGIGEDQFASFLRQEQAEQMVEAGGIGLAEALFHAMKARYDA